MSGKRLIAVLVAAGVVSCALARQAAEQEERVAYLHEVLRGLEHGIGALREIGRVEEAEHLEQIAEEVRQELGDRPRPNRERAIMMGQIEAMQLAMPVLREAERREAAEALRRAIRAREVVLEGRDDEEARQIRERGPRRGQVIEIMVFAEGLYREFGMPGKADRLSRLTEELWGHRRAERLPDDVVRDLEIMEMAIHAMREAEETEAAKVLKHALQARVVDARELEGEEAEIVRERRPELAQQVELLRWAAELWQKFGHEERAHAVADLADRMWAERDREAMTGEGRLDEVTLERIRSMEQTINGLEHVIDGLREEIRALRKLR